MHKYKLINYKDVIKLWCSKWYIFLIAVVVVLTTFFALESGKATNKYIAKASISLNYYENGHFDYEISQRLASNFNRFSLSNDVLTKLQTKNVSLKSIQFSNVLLATAVSENADIAVNTANELAKLQCDVMLESNIDNVVQKTVFKIEKLADNADILKANITTKQKTSIIAIVLIIIAIALIFAEILRTNVKTIEEARLITNIDYVLDISSANALQELNKVVNGRSLALASFTKVEQKENLDKVFGNTIFYADEIMNNAEQIDVLRKSEIVIIYIAKNRVDYRDLQAMMGLLQACNIKPFAVVMA